MKFLIIALIAAFSLACNTTGVPTEFVNACDVENDKKYIEISGFLDDKGGVFCSNIGGGNVKCGFKLRENPGDERSIGADIEQGSGANTVEKLERGYKREDVKIRDNSGNVISMTDRVKLTGMLSTAPNAAEPKNSVCFLKVSKIEK